MKKTKIVVWLVSGLVAISLLIVNYFGTYSFCGGVASPCVDTLASWVITLLIFIPVFLIASVACFLRDEVFLSWFRFSCWWIPITVILTFITPEGPSGFGVGSVFGPDVIAVVSALLYFVISGATILERANRKI